MFTIVWMEDFNIFAVTNTETKTPQTASYDGAHKL